MPGFAASSRQGISERHLPGDGYSCEEGVRKQNGLSLKDFTWGGLSPRLGVGSVVARISRPACLVSVALADLRCFFGGFRPGGHDHEVTVHDIRVTFW